MKFGKNILFVMAHPDDECMFFTPTIYALKEKSNLYLLVLSNGGYDGLGKIREKEMEKAARQMGFKDLLVIDSKAIPDGPHPWDVEACVEEIMKHLKERKDEGIEIKTIVTFDELGVSTHPNHISTYHACMKVQ
jgi:N-acetylglucosaminylphosphatidylinositol deacetylase